MKVLIAEDEAVSRAVLERSLTRQGYDVVVTRNGTEAWAALQADDAPQLAVLDWMMPGYDGLELCRMLRARVDRPYVYALLVTARNDHSDTLTALEAGADDFISKPYDGRELDLRLRAGQRVIQLQQQLAVKVEELQSALSKVTQLEGILPICMHCKRIRDGEQHWQRLETYIAQRSSASFSHALCSSCLEEHYPEEHPSPADQTQATSAPVPNRSARV